MLILDTKLLSELMRDAPKASVVHWIDRQPQSSGIVMSGHAILAPRNTAHFSDLGSGVVNPWNA